MQQKTRQDALGDSSISVVDPLVQEVPPSSSSSMQVPPPAPQVTDDEVTRYFASHDLYQIVRTSTEELEKLEEAFQGGIITNPSQLTEIKSLTFRLDSSNDFSEQ